VGVREEVEKEGVVMGEVERDDSVTLYQQSSISYTAITSNSISLIFSSIPILPLCPFQCLRNAKKGNKSTDFMPMDTYNVGTQ
jgi:hypothetical protein